MLQYAVVSTYRKWCKDVQVVNWSYTVRHSLLRKKAGLPECPWWPLSTAEIAYNGHVSVRTGPWSNGINLPSFIWGRWQQDGKKAGQQSQFNALTNVLLGNMDPRMWTWKRVQGIALAFKFPRSLSNWASMGITSDTWWTHLTACRNERICC